MDVEFDVTNQIVTRTDKNKTVNYSDDYLRLCFDFKTEDWSATSKFLLVWQDDEVYRFGLTEDNFVVPDELLTKNKLVFSIYGVTQTYRITTPKVLVKLLESGYTTDIADFNPEDFSQDIVEEIYSAINLKSDIGHTHTKSQITDFSHNHDERYYTESEMDTLLSGKANSTHTHTKNQITDFTHTHTKSDITDWSHNHDERYYTETEVQTLLTELKGNIENKIKLTVNKTIIQDDETATLTAKVKQDGFVVEGATIKFYSVTEE